MAKCASLVSVRLSFFSFVASSRPRSRTLARARSCCLRNVHLYIEGGAAEFVCLWVKFARLHMHCLGALLSQTNPVLLSVHHLIFASRGCERRAISSLLSFFSLELRPYACVCVCVCAFANALS